MASIMYACSYAKIDCSKFMNVTARLALQLIPEHLQNEPVFLCIDDTMVNLINIVYCAMKILSYNDKSFAQYRDTSAQEFRLALSEQINQEVIFAAFVENAETAIKSNVIIKALKSVLLSFGYHG